MPRPPANDSPGRRALLPVAILALIVLAGCNNPLVTGHQYPPGVNESGVQNATALADAHRAQLQQGYRIHERGTIIAKNDTVLLEIESRTRWSQARANRTITYSRPHPLLGARSEVYVNDSAIFARRTTASGNTSTRKVTNLQPSTLLLTPSSAWEEVYAMVGARNTTVTMLPNGTTRVRFRNAQFGRGTGNGTLYVTPEGLVTRYTGTFQRRWINTPVTYHRRVTVTHVGDPAVVKPRWVANASTAG